MKINGISQFYPINQKNNNKNQSRQLVSTQETVTKPFELRPQFNDYLISFGARVDKGLNRFFNVNKDRMPLTVYNFVESLPDREVYTPLEAQQEAYSNLYDAESVADIKNDYKNEPLFQDLKEVSEVKTTRGILKSMQEMGELYEDGVLTTKQDFTVYLMQKLFLEFRTLKEINEDLENDLDKDFKVYFKGKNPDAPYVHTSTLKALGIKLPNTEYLQSLRYTQDGYSDMMGAKVKQGLEDFWRNLPPEARLPRAKKSVENIEKWWNSLSQNEKLDLIASQDAELEMLKAYNRTQRAKKRKLKDENASPEVLDSPENETIKKTVKVGSSKLSQDELFKIWSSNKIKLFEARLSQADKDTLHIKRMNNLFMRWKEMTAVERTDYISKMKSGLEPLRYTMIEAWNNSMDIITDLYKHLKENQVYKPADLLYSTDEFSKFQSRVMSEFWEQHPDYAEKLGTRIDFARQKVENAIRNGNFEELKNQINRNKNDRKRELEQLKKQEEKANMTPKPVEVPVEKDYKTEFKEAYSSHVWGKVRIIPKNYYSDVYDFLLEILPEDVVKLWTRNLRQEQLTDEELAYVQKHIQVEPPQLARISRALEAAAADTLYSFTKNPEVYEMSSSDVKTALYHLERREEPIQIFSHKTGRMYTMNIVEKKKHPDANRINTLYESYKKDLSFDELEDIVRYNFYFSVKGQENDKKTMDEVNSIGIQLFDYIKTYGRSAAVLFSAKSAYPPEVKLAFAKKFLANMPENLKNSKILHCYYDNDIDIEKETKITKARGLFAQRFPFVPKSLMDSYFDEVRMMFLGGQEDQGITVDEFLNRVCVKRKDIKSRGTIAVIPKHSIRKLSTKYNMLALEQTMADLLYEATGNEDVYKLSFEILCDKFELFSFAKSGFPMEPSLCKAVDGNEVSLVLKKRLNTNPYVIQKRCQEYMNEICDRLEEANDSQPLDYEDLLYSLNPEQNNPERDINTSKRIATYFQDFQGLKFSIAPNLMPEL